MTMQPAKLGYGEVHIGADPKKLLPKTINQYWSSLVPTNPYVKQMKIFLEEGLKPYSMLFTKPGINRLEAINHLLSIKNSFLLDKSTKLAALSLLSASWFRYIKIDISIKEHFKN
jgi:plasmid rolling circle replication initiator protein Rep